MELAPFHNEPETDFSREDARKNMRDALSHTRGMLGREYPLVIDGQRITVPQKFSSYNPSRKDEVIGIFQKATAGEAERSVQAAASAFEKWRRVPALERATLLLRAAELVRRRRFELTALMAYEVGKNWPEGDGEVAETADHLEYSARQALRYAEGKPLPTIVSELNLYVYEPLGVVAIISPWNFPLALAAGMICGAIAAGNTVVVKTASDSPASLYPFIEILEEAGLPDGAINLLTGAGEVVGNALITHPKVRMVAFTGSRDVGCQIYEQAARVQPGQIWLKRVIAEMGGKNAIIVDETADLEAAADAAVVSAFSYQGQKCSAGSRLVVTADAYDRTLEMVIARTRALEIGPAPDNYAVGPVINADAARRILDYVRIGQREGRLLAGGERADGDGHYIQPTVIADVAPNARIAQEEIFGPVVAVIKTGDFNAALEISNGTEYGLTGSVFTKDPERIADARARYHCGNLYINRKCTGALMGVHPFGGINMSGTDSKVGGPDYLLNFMQPKSISIKYR
jgi:1-pyrroline-5-carboxylate dehydrogenase